MQQDHSTRDDEWLVREAQSAPEGDLRAMDALVLRYQSRILANCRYLTGPGAEAEDLAQEVFVKAYFNIHQFAGRSQFKTWLQRIKINHCLNHLKKEAEKKFVQVDDPQVAGAAEMQTPAVAEEALNWQESREEIAGVLDALPETLRVPLILRDADGLSYQEIAESLGIGLSAVKMRIKRGREEFRCRFAGASPAGRQPDTHGAASP